MKLYKSRRRFLSEGWYPEKKEEIEKIITAWEKRGLSVDRGGIAAVVPHAGWFFSGDIAFGTISALRKDPDTVVIVGGHLREGAVPLLYNYRELETPLGPIPVDIPFLEALEEKRVFQSEKGPDNTIEIQLSLIKYFFPKSYIAAFRIGSGIESMTMGKEIHAAAKKLKRSIVVIGSTDLTHYGNTYSFTPHGEGTDGLAWVKNINDKRIIDEMIAMDEYAVLESGNRRNAACSAGAAVCALSFSKESGRTGGHMLFYRTSYDVYPGDSFVGYTGIYY